MAAAHAHALPVCGPNGNGIVSLPARMALWGDMVAPREPGAVALISQSGNVAVNALASRRGLRLHTVVSCGNQAALEAADWLEAVAGLDGVRSAALYLEDDGDGERWCAALERCATAGIGVAVLKAGASRRALPPRRRTPARSPATSASFARSSRRRERRGPATRTSCSSWPRRWPCRGAGGRAARCLRAPASR